jgi:putative nucleotidyltransferase with HDIG domain
LPGADRGQTATTKDAALTARLRPSAATIAYLLTVGGGAGVIASSLGQLVANNPGLPWFILAGLTLVSGVATLRLPNAPASFSISDSFTITAALLFGPAAGTVIVLIDTLAISWQLARRDFRLRRLLFNIAAPALAMWLATQCFFWIAGVKPLIEDQRPMGALFGPLLLFTALYFVLNTGLIACAIALEQGGGPVGIWRRHFLPLWVAHFGGVSVAVLLITLVHSRGADLTVLPLVAPIPLILYAMFKHAVGRVGDHLAHLEHVNKMHLATIDTLAHAIDAKDQVTHGHLRRVQRSAVRLASALGIEECPDRRAIEAASLLHDLGKLAVPERILNKPGKLTAAEFETMRQHASVGADILSSIDFPYPVVPIVRHHHENWDGTGYPAGLRGEAIPIGARILAVVDCFDALTSDRPYRAKMSVTEATAILQERSGTMYDPRIVTAFLQILATEPANEEATPAVGAFTVIAETAQEDAARRLNASASVDPSVLGIILDAGAAIADDRRPIGESLHDVLTQLMPVTCTAVYVHDPSAEVLVGRYVAGRYESTLRGMTIPFGQRVTGWVAAQGCTIVNSDAALDLGSIAMQLSPSPRSCLSTRISFNDDVVGVLTIYSAFPEAYTPFHVSLIEALAPRIAERLLDGSYSGAAAQTGASPPPVAHPAPARSRYAAEPFLTHAYYRILTSRSSTTS